MELGETFEETVRREAVEELGLYPESLELLRIYSGLSQHYTYPNGDEVYVIATTFLCTKYTGTLTVDPEECMEARFFEVDDFPEGDQVHPPDRPMLRDVKRRMQLGKPMKQEELSDGFDRKIVEGI